MQTTFLYVPIFLLYYPKFGNIPTHLFNENFKFESSLSVLLIINKNLENLVEKNYFQRNNPITIKLFNFSSLFS
jgi:hypothetical protein